MHGMQRVSIHLFRQHQHAEFFREVSRIRPDVPRDPFRGYNEKPATERCAGRGPKGFLQKPYPLDTLTTMLREE
jgi:hypothetical protein